MNRKMRILVLSTDLWDDISNGNNIQSNWFNGFDAEIANIYLVPGKPNNQICTRYFQVTDAMMAKSFFGRRAGHAFIWNPAENYVSINDTANVENENVGLYKKLRAHTGEWLRLARDILWAYGRYDKKALKAFIDDFQPDIVFCQTTAVTPKSGCKVTTFSLISQIFRYFLSISSQFFCFLYYCH